MTQAGSQRIELGLCRLGSPLRIISKKPWPRRWAVRPAELEHGVALDLAQREFEL
tara:strand:+ start:630 stop:794 length:165 start_codon:yes stop_codon:yes gene_type:complete